MLLASLVEHHLRDPFCAVVFSLVMGDFTLLHEQRISAIAVAMAQATAPGQDPVSPERLEIDIESGHVSAAAVVEAAVRAALTLCGVELPVSQKRKGKSPLSLLFAYEWLHSFVVRFQPAGASQLVDGHCISKAMIPEERSADPSHVAEFLSLRLTPKLLFASLAFSFTDAHINSLLEKA